MPVDREPQRRTDSAPPADQTPAARVARRVWAEPDGPLLVEGPVEFCLPDGATVVSDRFMVAVCTCRHSATYPWCDTTHRHLRRPGTTGTGARESPVEEHGKEGT